MLSENDEPKEDLCPGIPLDLLEFLEKRHPEKSAIPGDTLDELMWLGAKRDLIRWLRLEYEYQTSPKDEQEE